MKIIIILLFLTIIAHGQNLQKKLENYKPEIIKKLKEFGEIEEKDAVNESLYPLLYSRVLSSQSRITIYEIGITDSHSYKYISILNDNKLIILPTKNFNTDFTTILDNLKNSKCKTKIFETLLTIKKIYDYNSNPPWGLKWDLKN